MTYRTQADLVREFGAVELVQLTDRDEPPTGEIDAERVAKAIETAAAEINVYLEGRYSLPLASVPTVLRRVAVDMARYFLHIDITEDHPVAQRYARQVKLLRGIADGTLSLGLDTSGAVQTPADTVQVSAGRNDWGPTGERVQGLFRHRAAACRPHQGSPARGAARGDPGKRGDRQGLAQCHEGGPRHLHGRRGAPGAQMQGGGAVQWTGQLWMVVLAVKHAGTQRSGEGARRIAGPLIWQLLEGLIGWQPLPTWAPLRRATGPKASYKDGVGYYPFVFRSHCLLRGKQWTSNPAP